MIDEIHVRNVALIEEATLLPAQGMTVLTGETGAGKTALLSACKLLMGERADRTMVREGTEAAQIEGRFYLPSEEGEQEVVVSRGLTADGRSRVSVNGSMQTVGALAELIGPTVDLCGQHEHQTLARPAMHGALLDGWAGDDVAPLLEAYGEAFEAAKEARSAYEAVKAARCASAAALDEARFVLRQMEGLSLDLDEYDELTAYLSRTENAEALARAAHGACECLSGDGGALDLVSEAMAALAEGERFDAALGPYGESLREASYVLEDVAREMASYGEAIEFDPNELAAAQERVAALQGLMRSYGPRLEDVVARRDEAQALVDAVDGADLRESEALAALEAAEASLGEAARALHGARAAAAPRFAQEVSEGLMRLEMGSARLTCACELLPRDEWGPRGPSRVEFLFRPGEGMQPRPLSRIASGGEMSRVMLAVHVALGEHDGVQTLVFDEVDAGVGGSTAHALALVLADLARSHQVLVVTHLAQVAVFGDAHYVVRKQDGPVPQTSLERVEGAERTDEVARLLSGTTTDASRAHAAELLASARRDAAALTPNML